MKLLAKPITEFTYEELQQLRSFVDGNEFRAQRDKLWDAHYKTVQEKAQKNRLAREKVKEREAEEYKYLKAFALWLNRDNLISFRGTKGSPYRKIVEINESTILGLVVNRRRDKNGNIVLSGNSSENGICNINGYMDKDGVWRDRKWIIELGKKLV